jgi:DNA (cytosine-5)-methyltransferase 1
MRYLSVCSGIEAATVAWHTFGWTPVAFSEIEAFPSAVLAHHYPDIPNYGDMTQHEQWSIERGAVDLLVGGTPCQSFSVAGLRQGLRDPRGGLMLTYLEIAQRLQPRWIVWENVPGVLSSNGGRDFGSFLGALGELGYGWAYRVLDAQWCRTHRHPRAVPQRRRRVFVVGCLGDGDAAAAVLFERESVRRDTAARRATGQGSAADAESGAGAGCWWDGGQVSQTLDAVLSKGQTMPERDRFPAVLQAVPYDLYQITAPINRQNRQPGDPCHTLARDNAAHAAVAVSDSLVANNNQCTGIPTEVVAHAFYSTGGTHGVNRHPEVSPAVKVGSGLGIPSPPAVATRMTVRRLTPRECERLQGFPDSWTEIPWRGKPASECPDGPRYRALGNSMAVNCMEWIGERIAAQEAR